MRERQRRMAEYRTKAQAHELFDQAVEQGGLIACRGVNRNSTVYINPRRYAEPGHGLSEYFPSVLDQIMHTKDAKIVFQKVEDGRIIFS